MKIRNGFVSNSSSSSFIVIDAKKGYEELETKSSLLVVDKEFGETEFGWGPETLRDIGSRIIFAYFQAQYADRDDWIEMLETVIKENSLVREFEWIVDVKDSDCYIDHQSIGSDNCDMFKDEQELHEFIFGVGSKVVLDNDNH